MKIIKEGHYPDQDWWIGHVVTCTKCGAVWEVEKEDLTFAAADPITNKADAAKAVTIHCMTMRCHNVTLVLRRDVLASAVQQTVLAGQEFINKELA